MEIVRYNRWVKNGNPVLDKPDMVRVIVDMTRREFYVFENKIKKGNTVPDKQSEPLHGVVRGKNRKCGAL